MSYDLISNGISGLMLGLGLQRSRYSLVDNIPSTELGNVFLISPVSGSNDEKASETLSALVYDVQTWKVEVPFPKSNENQDVNNDAINRKRELIIKTLDNPANWESYVRTQKFIDWSIEDRKSLFLLTVRLKIVDTVIY